MVGTPSPFGTITMGGIYTNVLIRPRPVDVDRFPGWYEYSAGTVAGRTSSAQAARDGIRIT